MYYLPCTNWIRQYRWSFVQGDLIAALTMASFYIPMSLSYASNLAHIPPINGLYAFVFNPLIYAVLGTCPQMVVGPEAAGSLLTGQVVREAINSGHHGDHAGRKNAQVAGMVTGLAGAIILAAGLCRLGFLDSVLSRPFLRGFISAIGVVILSTSSSRRWVSTPLPLTRPRARMEAVWTRSCSCSDTLLKRARLPAQLPLVRLQ